MIHRPHAGFSQCVKDLFDDRSLCDVTIIVDNDEKSPDNLKETVAVQAHRLVLAVMSGYFQKALCDNSSDDNRSEIRLAGVPYSIFQKCLKFMYHGFDKTLFNMTLEDGIKFFSMAKTLEMDTKVKQSYSKWISENLSKWEQQLWTIFTMAVEYDLPEVTLQCKNYVTDVANEFLFVDGFRTVPLSIVQMVLSCEKMNCTKSELKEAIKCWIASNQIDDHVSNQLLSSVQSRKEPFFKGEETKFYKTMKLQVSEPRNTTNPNIAAPATMEHCYSSSLHFLKNTMLTGITFFLERNMDSTKITQKVMGTIELHLTIGYFYIYFSEGSVKRTIHISYNLTQHSSQKVTIFFPEFNCFRFTNYKFEFKWKGEGVQPVLHRFGQITHDLAKADTSLVWSIYHTKLAEDDEN